MKVRLFNAFLLCFICISLFTGPTHVQAESQKEIPIHLKMGKFFILYTQPSPPFVDANHRLLIPIRINQDLMGGSVSYDDSTKTATLLLLDHTFEVTIQSSLVKVDGETFNMDTTPILKGGSMYLPIRIFLDYTDVQYTWDQKNQLLHITDERVVKGQPFEYFEGNDFSSGSLDDAFNLTVFTMNPSSLSIRARNISGENIAHGKSDIHPFVLYKDSGFSTDSYTKRFNPDLPEVKKDSSITVTQHFDLLNVAYIISVGRRVP